MNNAPEDHELFELPFGKNKYNNTNNIEQNLRKIKRYKMQVP